MKTSCKLEQCNLFNIKDIVELHSQCQTYFKSNVFVFLYFGTSQKHPVQNLHCALELYAPVSVVRVLLCAEEILQTHVAHWWSPDGLRLAYMTINDTLVPSMEVPYFTGMPYPATLEYRYPKASPLSSRLLLVAVSCVLRTI